MPTVTELSSIDDLARVRVTWQRLWDECPDASFFQSWDWLRSYLRIFGEDQKPRVMVVSDGGRPIGIVPLMQQNTRTRLGVAGVLKYPLDDWGTTFGPLGEDVGAALTSAVKFAAKKNRDWNAIELAHIEDTGMAGERTRAALEESKLRQEFQVKEHSAVQLDESWDWFLESQTGYFRETLDHAEKDLGQYGPVSFYRWRPGGNLNGDTNRRWDLVEIFEQLLTAAHEPTPQSEQELALIRDAHAGAVDLGAVEIGLLSISGRSIACSYGYCRNGTVEQLFVAGLPQVPSALPVLLGWMIRDSFMRNDRRILFRQPDELVQEWCNSSVSTLTLSHFDRMSPQAQLLKKQLLGTKV